MNGEYVMGVHNDIDIYGEKTITTEVNHRFFGSQIINIVTKEQFESIKYEVN